MPLHLPEVIAHAKCSIASAVVTIMYAVGMYCPDVAFAQNYYKPVPTESGDLPGLLSRLMKYSGILWTCAVDGSVQAQSIFATSSAEAEYIAAFDASKEAVWVRKFISGLGVVPTIEKPINMYCDNTGAIAIANESGITKASGRACLRVCVSTGRGDNLVTGFLILGLFDLLVTTRMTTSSANNSVFKGFFEKQKLTGPNFIDWYRQLKIVLSTEDKLNYLKQPRPPALVAPKGQQVAPEIIAAHNA
ncbi:hypothetical protein Tco_0899713 [Tanacetum coccineum]